MDKNSLQQTINLRKAIKLDLYVSFLKGKDDYFGQDFSYEKAADYLTSEILPTIEKYIELAKLEAVLNDSDDRFNRLQGILEKAMEI